MTFIKPNKNDGVMNLLIGVLSVAVVAGVFGMVALYNLTVNLNHNIAQAKTELDAIGAANTKLSNQVIATLGSGSGLTAVVAADGLVEDQKPQYFRTDPQWPIASQ